MVSKRYPESRYFQHFETFHREENGGKRGDGNSFLWLAGFWWWRRRNGPPGSTSSALPTAKATAYVAEGGAKKARARARTRFRQASGQLTTAWASRVFLGSSSNCTEGRRVLLILLLLLLLLLGGTHGKENIQAHEQPTNAVLAWMPRLCLAESGSARQAQMVIWADF